MPIELIHQGKVATIELNVPPVNAFNSEEWHQFAKLVDDLSFSEEVNSLVIRAQGKGFCAGVDIKELQKDADKIYEVNDGCWKLGRAIHNCNVPVISACHGFVLGGGILIAGASDIVLATKDAYFGLPEIDRGALGGGAHLSRLFSLQKVRKMMFTGEPISAINSLVMNDEKNIAWNEIGNPMGIFVLDKKTMRQSGTLLSSENKILDRWVSECSYLKEDQFLKIQLD